MKKVMLSTIGAMILLGVSGAMAFDTEGDAIFTDDTTVEMGDRIKGNVTISGGTLTVEGEVLGNVHQKGDGGVVVDGGLVEGNIWETSDGSVEIKNRGHVKGTIREKDDGDVYVLVNSLLEGNIHESDTGGVTVTGTHKGNVFQD